MILPRKLLLLSALLLAGFCSMGNVLKPTGKAKSIKDNLVIIVPHDAKITDKFSAELLKKYLTKIR